MKKIVLLVSLLMLSGCSVGMAMSGSQNPNLGVIKRGASRGEVEMQLASPIKTTTLSDGSKSDIYQYEIGNEPSAGRASMHGILDFLTFFLWEIVGTPIEACQGDKYEAVVSYNQDDIVKSISTIKK